MIQVFKTDEDYKKWLNGQTLPSGIVVYVSDDETMYFSTNNIKGELKTYKCEKDEVIQYPPLVYSAKSAGSKLTVNGQSVTLEQGDNITLEYPNEITSVKATNNTALTYIQIPNTVTSIESDAFNGCASLASVNIPDTVTSIGDSAFNDCAALTDFNFNGTMAQWGAITLGTYWKNNAAFTVVHCTDGDVSLEEPIQPNNLVYSAKSAGSTITVNGQSMTLEQGDNITLEYPNEITSVKATNNTALTYIQIPNTVTSIEDGDYNTGSFYKCTALASVSLPDTMTMIGNYAFSGCDALGSVTLHEGIKNIGVGAFYNCTSLLSITIPESVTSISRLTFSGCHALGSVTLPNTLVSIGDSAFSSCSSLVSITIPEGVTSIGLQAFSGCHALGSVTLPNTLVSIGKRAFNDCAALTDFNFNGTMAQWGAITLGIDWKRNSPVSVVHCTDGDVTV